MEETTKISFLNYTIDYEKQTKDLNYKCFNHYFNKRRNFIIAIVNLRLEFAFKLYVNCVKHSNSVSCKEN